MAGYQFADIEAKWQKYWEDHKVFQTPEVPDETRQKFYILDMFPYPSGVGLHVGHPLGYIATDIVARFKRMRGFNVLHPIGFDAFGLPAEQFAVEHGVHPRITTERNVGNMLRQLKKLGLTYDWDRVFSTTDPGYYKWTQWIFLQLYSSYYDPESRAARPIAELVEKIEQGRAGLDVEWDRLDAAEREEVLASHRLAYMAEVDVNWCPALGTVLANEEVTNEGRSERGNYPVYQRPLRQWMLRITAYADRLEDDLELVSWPEPIKMMQRNWIGRSEGALVDFPLDDGSDSIRVFTTRPDTLFGATYMVLAPEHPLVEKVTSAEQEAAIREYQRMAAGLSEVDRMADAKRKSGVFTGGYAVNPVNGERLPIWIADYVLMGYGTGAIMAVPGHDQRDFEFAKQFDLPIRIVVMPPAAWLGSKGVSKDDYEKNAEALEDVFDGDGISVNSSGSGVSLDGQPSDEAKRSISDWLEQTGQGRREIQYKLRDWLFSRQRYWGEPFPILHGPEGQIRPVDDDDLPVRLPDMEDFKPTASDDPDAPPRPPLGRATEDWRFVQIDGVRYERELNTMPQWAGSCWYYLRFIDPGNENQFVRPKLESYWMKPTGVDLYVGGAEHAVLHLLYARFWHKVLYDLGQVSTSEPFARLVNQGYIQAYAYRDERGVVVPADEVVDQDGRPASDVQDQSDRRYFWDGKPVRQEFGKMGKSLKNATGPDEVSTEYGCDTFRLYEMYLGPLEASKPWSTRDIIGVHRFLRRVWRNLVDEESDAMLVDDGPPTEALERAMHKTIKRVTDDLERLSFNTAIAALIEFVSEIVGLERIPRSIAERLVLLLSPMAPHISEELWRRLGYEETLGYEPWPTYDESMVAEEEITIAVQVNGKVRGSVTVAAQTPKDKVLARARAEENVARHLEGKTLRREIYVPRKIVNFVVQ